MTDVRIRALEPAVERGNVDEAVACIAAALRAGAITDERVRLAAALDHPAARAALASSDRVPPVVVDASATQLADTFASFGDFACTLAAPHLLATLVAQGEDSRALGHAIDRADDRALESVVMELAVTSRDGRWPAVTSPDAL